VVFLALVFYAWVRRYRQRKASELDGMNAYKLKRAAVSGIVFPSVGVLFIAIVLFNWRSMPRENRLVGIMFIAWGAGMIVYGLYKMWSANRERH
jgi:uncharacterized membrane protein